MDDYGEICVNNERYQVIHVVDEGLYSRSDQNRRRENKRRINYGVKSDAHDYQMRHMYDRSGQVNTRYKLQNQRRPM